jgi:hypothetical protein
MEDKYKYQPYPKFMFAKDAKEKSGFKSQLVRDEASEKKLGKEWVDSPAKLGIESHPGVDGPAKKEEPKAPEKKD